MKLILTFINFIVVCLTYLTILYASVGVLLSIMGYPIGNNTLVYGLLVIAVIVFIISIGLLKIGIVKDQYIRDNRLMRIESDELDKVLSDICSQLKIDKPTVYYDNSQEINASVVSKDMLILNKGFVEFATKYEIFAVTAHEAGHLKHGDSRYFEYNYILRTMASGILGFTEGLVFGKTEEQRDMPVLLMVLLFPLMFYLLILRLAWFVTSNLTFLIDRISSPYKEYRADRYCVELGFGDHLITFANKLMEKFPEERKERRFFSTHPTWKQRIEAIRKLQEKEVLNCGNLACNRN